jgi:hypothetical protein
MGAFNKSRRTRQRADRGWQAWLAGPVVVALVACGGGGDLTGEAGGGGSSTWGSIRVTQGNQVALTRAALMSTVAVIPFDIEQAVTSVGSGGDLARAGSSARQRVAAAPVVLPIEACAAGGTRAVTLDDRDGSLGPSLGDMLDVTFTACSDDAETRVDGRVHVVLTQWSTAPMLSLQAEVSTASLVRTALDGSRTVRYEGSARVEYARNSASDDYTAWRVPAGAALTLAVAHPRYTDTLTWLPGLAVGQRRSGPGPVGPASRRVWYEINGPLASAAAGGWVSAFAAGPLLRYIDRDAFPSEGQAQVVGELGALQLQIPSVQQVQIDLDTHTGITERQLIDWAELI